METNTTTLLDQLYRLEWLLRRKDFERYRENAPWSSPHRGQGRVLALLKLHPEISQRDLGSILDIRNQSLGELLSKLEKQGLIERESSDEDKRTMIVRLTDEGKAAANEQPDSDDPDAFAACLNEGERESLAGYLRRIIESLETQIGAEGFGPRSQEDFFHDPRGGFGDPAARMGRRFGNYDPRRRAPRNAFRDGFPPRDEE